MAFTRAIATGAILTVLSVSPSWAQVSGANTFLGQGPEQHFSFDGDTGIATIYESATCKAFEDGLADHPCVRFVPGYKGEAIELGDGATLAVQDNVDPREFPQLTVTAWVKRTAGSRGSGYIFSDGEGAGGFPHFAFYGGELTAKAGRFSVRYDKGLVQPPLNEWTFVAAIWDYEAHTLRVYSGESSVAYGDLKMDLDTNVSDVQRVHWTYDAPDGSSDDKSPYYFIGAGSFRRFGGTAWNTPIDEVHVFKRALTEDEITTLRNGGELLPQMGNMCSPGTAGGDTGLVIGGTVCAPNPTPDDTGSVVIGETEKNLQTPLPTGDVQIVGAGGGSGKVSVPVSRPITGGGGSAPYDVTELPDDLGTPTVPIGAPVGDDTGSATSGPQFPQAGLPDGAADVLGDAASRGRPIDIGYGSEEEAEAAAAERARQAEEAAAAEDSASGGETTTRTQALEPSTPHPVGARVLSSVSGVDTGQTHFLDLESHFMTEIGWDEKADMPCALGVFAPGANIVGEEFGCPKTIQIAGIKPPAYTQNSVSLEGAVIGRLQVCNADNSNKRMKGLRIWGDVINPDGTTTYSQHMDEEVLPNCDGSWAPSVFCPVNTLGTGVTVYTTDAGGDKKQIVGLSLICRAIGVD